MNIMATSTHKLAGNELKKWWQVNDFFKIFGSKSEQDKFNNPALKKQMHAALMVPFAIGILAYAVLTSDKPIAPNVLAGLIAGACIVLAAVYAHLVLTFHHQLFRIQQVEITDVGLNLKSCWLKRNIRWDQIQEHYYLNQDNDFVLRTNANEEFILSAELTESGKLFSAIENRANKPATIFTSTYRLPDSVIDGFSGACLIVAAVLLASNLRALSIGKFDSQTILVAIFALIMYPLWMSFQRRKIVRSIRSNAQTVSIRTASGAQSLQWNEIESVKKAPVGFTLNTKRGKFHVLIDKNEDTATLLIDNASSSKRTSAY